MKRSWKWKLIGMNWSFLPIGRLKGDPAETPHHTEIKS